MTTFAYLRVSTDQQDRDNQRHGILEYANAHRLGPLEFVEDAVSGRIGWRDRAVGELLLETASEGDVVLFAEVSCMGRSTLQVLEMLETCMKRIRKRDRSFEKEISDEYMTELIDAYNHYYHYYNRSPLLVIDTRNLNFAEQPEHFEDLIQRISRPLKGTHYYQSLGLVAP